MSPVLKHQTIQSQISNIGFVSTRIAGTDGVSLEIHKWAEVLTRFGFNCFYFAGELDRPMDISLLVEEAHFEHPDIHSINQDIFGKRQRSRGTSDRIQEIKDHLKTYLYHFRDRYSIDLIIPENALAIPMNIPLALALTEFIAETAIPTIAHHHDFAWERNRFLVNACQDYINMAFPPDLPSIQHVVINSLAAEQLSHRRGISNTIVPNVLDFSKEPVRAEDSRMELRERIGLGPDDLFILQPTRVVPRKWIERSIEIVRSMDLARPILIISHATGDEGDKYYRRIRDYARDMGVQIMHIDHLISWDHNSDTSNDKLYRISDVYCCADLVTYPSGYEGFGNAFLESIYYRIPIVLNRYSIYISDIEPKGFDIILIDGFVGSHTIEQIWDVLKNPTRKQEMTEKNYRLATRSFSYEVLGDKLTHLLELFVERPAFC